MSSSEIHFSVNLNYEKPGWKFIKSHIQTFYGEGILRDILNLQKLEIKIVKLINGITFIRRCKTLNIIPNFLKVRNNWTHLNKSNFMLKNLQKKLLTEQIKLN